jgi:WD40 repeat protein
VLDLAVTADNARFASVGGDRLVFLWDVATATTLRRWSGHGGRVNAVALAGEGDSVVASGGWACMHRPFGAGPGGGGGGPEAVVGTLLLLADAARV